METQKKTAPLLEQQFREALASIESDAEAGGTNLTQICKKLKVSRTTPVRWKSALPTTIKLVSDMQRIARKARDKVARSLAK